MPLPPGKLASALATCAVAAPSASTAAAPKEIMLLSDRSVFFMEKLLASGMNVVSASSRFAAAGKGRSCRVPPAHGRVGRNLAGSDGQEAATRSSRVAHPVAGPRAGGARFVAPP